MNNARPAHDDAAHGPATSGLDLGSSPVDLADGGTSSSAPGGGDGVLLVEVAMADGRRVTYDRDTSWLYSKGRRILPAEIALLLEVNLLPSWLAAALRAAANRAAAPAAAADGAGSCTSSSSFAGDRGIGPTGRAGEHSDGGGGSSGSSSSSSSDAAGGDTDASASAGGAPPHHHHHHRPTARKAPTIASPAGGWLESLEGFAFDSITLASSAALFGGLQQGLTPLARFAAPALASAAASLSSSSSSSPSSSAAAAAAASGGPVRFAAAVPKSATDAATPVAPAAAAAAAAAAVATSGPSDDVLADFASSNDGMGGPSMSPVEDMAASASAEGGDAAARQQRGQPAPFLPFEVEAIGRMWARTDGRSSDAGASTITAITAMASATIGSDDGDSPNSASSGSAATPSDASASSAPDPTAPMVAAAAAAAAPSPSVASASLAPLRRSSATPDAAAAASARPHEAARSSEAGHKRTAAQMLETDVPPRTSSTASSASARSRPAVATSAAAGSGVASSLPSRSVSVDTDGVAHGSSGSGAGSPATSVGSAFRRLGIITGTGAPNPAFADMTACTGIVSFDAIATSASPRDPLKGKLLEWERARVDDFVARLGCRQFAVSKGDIARSLREYVNVQRSQEYFEKLVSRRHLNETHGSLLMPARSKKKGADGTVMQPGPGCPTTSAAAAAPPATADVASYGGSAASDASPSTSPANIATGIDDRASALPPRLVASGARAPASTSALSNISVVTFGSGRMSSVTARLGYIAVGKPGTLPAQAAKPAGPAAATSMSSSSAPVTGSGAATALGAAPLSC